MGKGASNRRVLRGISYGRVSTINQVLDSAGSVREDASPTAQRLRCHEQAKYLTQKTGIEYTIVEHISDEGFSAKNVKRPGYQKMWRLIASGTINFIMASELSRLSRSVTDFLDLVSHCQKNNVDLIIIGLDLDTSTPFGRVIVVILVALAQFEREMTSMRVRENALTRLLNDGKINGGAEILGLDRSPTVAGHFVRNDEELKNVEILMKLFLEVPSRTKLLEEATRRGMKGKHGQPLTMHSIRLMLGNAKWRYRGLWPANRDNKEKDQAFLADNRKYQEVKLPHGPLLDMELLDRVVAKVRDTYEGSRRSGAESYVYLLSGILVYEDGSKFSGQPGKNREYRYYYNYKQKIRLGCDEIDDFVRNKVKEYLVSHDRYHALVKEGFQKLQGMIPEIEERIKQVEKDLGAVAKDERKLLQTFEAANLSDPSYSDWLKKQIQETSRSRSLLEKELRALQERKDSFLNQHGLAEMRNNVKEYLDDGFKRLSPTMQRTVIQKVVPAVVVKAEKRIEIHLANPIKNLVTFEDESTDKERDGGRDGT